MTPKMIFSLMVCNSTVAMTRSTAAYTLFYRLVVDIPDEKPQSRFATDISNTSHNRTSPQEATGAFIDLTSNMDPT